MQQPKRADSAQALRPLKEFETEMFDQGLFCRVTSTIHISSAGRVRANSISWRAELCKTSRSTALLPDQFAIAIGKKGNTLIVTPVHCLL